MNDNGIKSPDLAKKFVTAQRVIYKYTLRWFYHVATLNFQLLNLSRQGVSSPAQ